MTEKLRQADPVKFILGKTEKGNTWNIWALASCLFKMIDTLTVPKELNCELLAPLAYLSILIPDKVRHAGLQEPKKRKKNFNFQKCSDLWQWLLCIPRRRGTGPINIQMTKESYEISTVSLKLLKFNCWTWLLFFFFDRITDALI